MKINKFYKLNLVLIVIAFSFIGCSDDNTPSTVTDKIINVKTFNSSKVAFADGKSQSSEGVFTFPSNPEKIKSIKMYIKDICPNKDCDEWDRYANIYVKDKQTGVYFELGRFITPYWVGNEKLERGYEFDVTDFKSILNGITELKIYTETWNEKGRTYSVEFDFQEGTPDYKYSVIIPVFQYNKSSIDGVPYGKTYDMNVFDLKKTISLPNGIELAYFRTIISGWGHAASGNCAEWCVKTHAILLNGQQTYLHKLAGLGCSDNPVNNQAPGNWEPDRAGWCPGMVVPFRFDNIAKEKFGTTFDFEYKFEDYVTTGEAYYAISTFLVLKSNQPINALQVTN